MLTRHTGTAKPMYSTTTPFSRPTFTATTAIYLLLVWPWPLTYWPQSWSFHGLACWPLVPICIKSVQSCECVLQAPGASCTPAHFSYSRRFTQSRPGWFPERSKHLWPGCCPNHFHLAWNAYSGPKMGVSGDFEPLNVVQSINQSKIFKVSISKKLLQGPLSCYKDPQKARSCVNPRFLNYQL